MIFSGLTEITHSLIYLFSLVSSGPLVKKSPLFTPHLSVRGSIQVERTVYPKSSIGPVVKPTFQNKKQRCQENYSLNICA